MILVLMGVSGSGKTTVAELLARQLAWRFLDADEFHSDASKSKMHAGIPLTDEDRAPWLEAMHRELVRLHGAGESVVLACSALKDAYRRTLQGELPSDRVRFVFLHGDSALIANRLERRRGTFMNPALLQSQLATLEPPREALSVDVAGTPEEVVADIRKSLDI